MGNEFVVIVDRKHRRKMLRDVVLKIVYRAMEVPLLRKTPEVCAEKLIVAYWLDDRVLAVGGATASRSCLARGADRAGHWFAFCTSNSRQYELPEELVMADHAK